MNDLMTSSFLNYVELKKQAQSDIEMGEEEEEEEVLTQKDEENLSNFFKQVEAIKIDMQEISHLLLDLHALNEETKSAHSAKILRGLRDRMDSDMATVLRKTKAAKAGLDGLDNSNAANRESYPEGSAVDRARVSTASGMRVRLGEIMNGFRDLREKVVADYRDGLRRRYYNVTGEHPSEEVIEEMVSGKGAIHVKERERHEAVMDVWRSLNKLQQVFSDMAVLVEAQGHRVDDIEGNVANAASFVAGGTNSLLYAKQMNKEGRRNKWMCWLWGVGFLIVLVCIVAMLTD